MTFKVGNIVRITERDHKYVWTESAMDYLLDEECVIVGISYNDEKFEIRSLSKKQQLTWYVSNRYLKKVFNKRMLKRFLGEC